jgi:hypothetical protein
MGLTSHAGESSTSCASVLSLDANGHIESEVPSGPTERSVMTVKMEWEPDGQRLERCDRHGLGRPHRVELSVRVAGRGGTPPAPT